MGLDNGIVLQGVKRENIKVPWFVSFPFATDFEHRLDVCYWRKCWGIRERIRNLLHMDNKVYEAPVEEDDIPALIRLLENFLDKDYWDNNAESIWEYDEYKSHLLQQIKNLLWLREFLKLNPCVKCYFYDSY
jgi:hypothetical protein